MMRFRDRPDAGRRLAARLVDYTGRRDVFVPALPRGGVPVAFEIARALGAPLEVFLVRKLGAPGQYHAPCPGSSVGDDAADSPWSRGLRDRHEA